MLLHQHSAEPAPRSMSRHSVNMSQMSPGSGTASGIASEAGPLEFLGTTHGLANLRPELFSVVDMKRPQDQAQPHPDDPAAAASPPADRSSHRGSSKEAASVARSTPALSPASIACTRAWSFETALTLSPRSSRGKRGPGILSGEGPQKGIQPAWVPTEGLWDSPLAGSRSVTGSVNDELPWHANLLL